MEASHSSLVILFVFKILFIYFLERGEGREKERERIINVWLPLPVPLPGDLACKPGTCPHWDSPSLGDSLLCNVELNPLSHTTQGQIFKFNLHYYLVFPCKFHI